MTNLNPRDKAMKKTITKHFTSLKKAEQYQNRLYNQYESVQLIRSPMFSEEGIYTWEVSK